MLGSLNMKKLLAIAVLSLFLIIPSQADDISDFQIEGVNIGESLLDYATEEEIKIKLDEFLEKAKADFQ